MQPIRITLTTEIELHQYNAMMEAKIDELKDRVKSLKDRKEGKPLRLVELNRKIEYVEVKYAQYSNSLGNLREEGGPLVRPEPLQFTSLPKMIEHLVERERQIEHLKKEIEEYHEGPEYKKALLEAKAILDRIDKL